MDSKAAQHHSIQAETCQSQPSQTL